MERNRMTRNVLWTSLGVLGVLMLVVAGCGGKGSSSSAGQSVSTGGATGQQPAGGAKQGGTAHFNLATDTDFVDPALAYYQVSWQFEYATCAKLLNYPDKPGAAGSQLVPEVAAALPRISADGKTYIFKIRKGFKFSPPSNAAVTANTFKYAIERVQNPKMQSPGAQFISDVKSVTARGDPLTIVLSKKAPDFRSRIAMPFFCAIPPDTPI